MVGLGVLVGLINGFVTTVLRVPSLIGTLGMMLALSGLIFYWTGGSAGNNPVDSFRQIGRGGIRDIPVLEILPVLRHHPRSRADRGESFWSAARSARGSSRSAATRRRRVSAVFGSRSANASPSSSRRCRPPSQGSSSSGFAGVHPSVGQGYEFFTVTAVVLGGVALTGGRGWVLSAAAGAFALETLFVVLNFLGVPATYRDTVQGVIIIVAVALSQVDWGARGARRRRRDDMAPGVADPVPATPQ